MKYFRHPNNKEFAIFFSWQVEIVNNSDETKSHRKQLTLLIIIIIIIFDLL